MRALLALLALLGLAAPALAQTPDTTTAARYVPLAVGNEWHYAETLTEGSTTTTARIRTVVQSEVAGAPGRFVVEKTRVQLNAGGTETGTTYTQSEWSYSAATQRVTESPAGDEAVTPCSLGAPFGAPATSTCSYNVTGAYAQNVTVGSQTVVATVKGFSNSGGGGTTFSSVGYGYAAGIGKLSSSTFYVNADFPSQNRSLRRTLRFARVGGQEYGEPLIFPVAGETAPEAGAFGLSVSPNPSSSATSLRFTLPSPGRVRLTVVDVLGREVTVVTENSLAAGPHSAHVDTSRLAPGLYVVRLVVGDAVVTRRLTVAR